MCLLISGLLISNEGLNSIFFIKILFLFSSVNFKLISFKFEIISFK